MREFENKAAGAYWDARVERRFPIQGHTETGGSRLRIPPMTVPWIIGEIAYNDYSRRFGTQQSLEELARRGGFGQGEMDNHFPQWRELTILLDGIVS